MANKKTSNHFDGDLLHKDNKEFVEKIKKTASLTKRRARYWCFRFQSEVDRGVDSSDAPKGFKKFVESLKGFTEWSKFAITWDLHQSEDESFMIVHRVLSVWQEWDHVMDRVAIPVDATPSEVEARVATLTKEFARKYGN